MMIGESRIMKTWGSQGGDDDSVSGIYVTDRGTALVDPESQGSVSTGTDDTTSASTPTTIVTANKNKSKSIFRSNSSISNDDSMSGIYTTYSASMTKEERFRASVLAEERRIHKEYSIESGSGSFESDPNGSFLPTTLITAKTPSPDKKKSQIAKWSPFVGSVGTNDFDLESIASDGSMGGEGRFQVLGIKSMYSSSPRGTEETRSPSTLGSAVVLSSSSSSSSDASPDLVQAEDGYARRSRGATEVSSKAKKKAAAAATSQMRLRVCGCRLRVMICFLASIVAIAIAVAVGAFIASDHMSDSIEGDFASQTEFQGPTISKIDPSPLALSAPTAAPTAAPSPSTPAPSPLVVSPNVLTRSPVTFPPSMTPTPGPTTLSSTKGPTNSPAVAVTETASPTGPTNSPVFVVVTQGPTTQGPTTQGPTTQGPTTQGPTTQGPTAVPVTIEETQSPTAVPVAVTTTLAPVSLAVIQIPASPQRRPSLPPALLLLLQPP